MEVLRWKPIWVFLEHLGEDSVSGAKKREMKMRSGSRYCEWSGQVRSHWKAGGVRWYDLNFNRFNHDRKAVKRGSRETSWRLPLEYRCVLWKLGQGGGERDEK